MIRNTVLALTLAGFTIAPLYASAVSLHGQRAPDTGPSIPVLNVATQASETLTATKGTLRDLWITHAFWVRSVVIARHGANDGAETAAEAQVVSNAQALAAAFEPFYGSDAREALFGLLAGHYGAVKSYLDATQQHSSGGQKRALTALLSNADEIAVFLSGANPHLPHDAVLGLLEMHGGHHISQIEHLYAGEYAEEAEVWGDMTLHMYVIADALAGALAVQFPDRF